MSKNKSLTKLYLISPSEIIVNEFEKSLELVLKTFSLVPGFRLVNVFVLNGLCFCSF